MKKVVRLIPSLMVGVLTVGTVPNVYAMEGFNGVTTPKGVGKSEVTLNVEDLGGEENPEEPLMFSAFVPSELPIKMDLAGNVVVPTKAKIVNGVETKGICVTDINVALENGWSPSDWNDDFSQKVEDSQEIGLKLRGDMLRRSGEFTLDSEGWKIPKGASINLNMGVKIPKQTIEGNKGKIATVGFTLDWSGDDISTEAPDIPITTNVVANYENGLMLPGSSNAITFDWETNSDSVELVDIVSSDEGIVQVSDVATRIANTAISGTKKVGVKAVSRGRATVTATMSTGETASVIVDVSELDTTREITFDIDEEKLKAGDELQKEDVYVRVPIINSIGNAEVYTIHPDRISTIPLEEGNNSIDLEITLGGDKHSETVDVEVKPSVKVVSSIEVVNPAVNYQFGDLFKVQGLLKICYTDGSEAEIPLIEDMLNGFDTSTVGSKIVTVSYNDKTTTYEITVEAPVTNFAAQYKNGLMFPEDTNKVTFTWNKDNTNVEFTDIQVDDPSIAEVVGSTPASGKETVTLKALSRGRTAVTGKLNTGETASITVDISAIDPSKEITTEVDESKVVLGGTLTKDDITVHVPIIDSIGGKEVIDFRPNSVPSSPLTAGDNQVKIPVKLGNTLINVTLNIFVEKNPSNGLIMTVPEAQAAGFTFKSYKDGLEITGFENVNFSSTVNVPEQIGDFKVLSIGDKVFLSQSNLKTITLPDTVVNLGSQSLRGCSNAYIYIPDSVETVATYLCDSSFIVDMPFKNYPSYKGVQISLWSLTKSVKHIIYREGSAGTSFDNPINEAASTISMVLPPNAESFAATLICGQAKNLQYVVVPNTVKSVTGLFSSIKDFDVKIFYCGTESEWDKITWANPEYQHKNPIVYNCDYNDCIEAVKAGTLGIYTPK